MRTVVVQPRFARILQSYQQYRDEVSAIRKLVGAGNFFSGGNDWVFALEDDRTVSNILAAGSVALLETAGSGNTYTGSSRLAVHCDQDEIFGINPCYLADEDLKKYVWLFDHVVWPATTCETNIGGNTELVAFLMEKGWLSRPKFDVTQEIYVGNKFFKCFLLAFEQVEREENGSASVLQEGPEFYMPPTCCPTDEFLRRTLELKIYHALPVPAASVPLQDIIEFKIKNLDLLTRQRHYQDELYLKLIEDGLDVGRRNNSLIAKWEDHINEILSEMYKSGIARTLGSIAVQYKLPLSLAGCGLGKLLETPFELGSMVGAAAGYLTANISIDVVRGASFLGKEDRRTPLAYLFQSGQSFQLDPPAAFLRRVRDPRRRLL